MNKTNGIVIALLIILIGLVGYVAFKPNQITSTPVTDSTVINEAAVPVVPKATNTQTPPASTSMKTYSNTGLGFSFNYPSDWRLTEDTLKKEVTIDTNDIGGTNLENRDNPTYPSWKITFKAIDKSYFTQQRISTKMGIITYDETLKAFTVDDNGDLPGGSTCLKAVQLFGSNPPNPNNTSAIQSINYGGSLMSDPAYSDSAILTNNGEIIIIHSQQGTAATPELMNQLSKIASSFKLLNGNTVFVPACAK